MTYSAVLASKLDLQAIYDLVGDKLLAMFKAQTTMIATFDQERQTGQSVYLFENGTRFSISKPVPLWPLALHIIATNQPLIVNRNDGQMERLGITTIDGTQPAQSMIFVPYGSGGQVNGFFSLQDLDQENAYSQSDVRLLQTLANSMGIALENARLFNAEQQRNAELSVVSTVSQALVVESELDNIIQLIGRQMRNIFDADIVYLALLDQDNHVISFPYQYGETFTMLPVWRRLDKQDHRIGRTPID